MKRRTPLRRLVLIFVACLLTPACGSLPRDPEGTLQRVQGGRLRVGLVENPPWVVHTEGEPAGAEVELVRRFAAELGATPEWHRGGEQRHMEALERFELDIVVGGVTDSTPWAKYVGLTGPYFEEGNASGNTRRKERHVMAVAPGENGFLKRLEEFLARERPRVKELLEREAAR